MTESLDERLNRREKELGDKLREWPYGGPQAVPTYPTSVGESLASARAFDEYIRRFEEVRETWAVMSTGPALGHMLVANIEAVERLKKTSQPYCSFAELAGMDVIQSDLAPKDTVYSVRRPDMLPFQYEPIEFLEEDYKPFRISTMVGYKLGPSRRLVLLLDFGMCSEKDWPLVKWPEPVVPAQPLSWWQWLVIVGFLSWILCALSRAV